MPFQPQDQPFMRHLPREYEPSLEGLKQPEGLTRSPWVSTQRKVVEHPPTTHDILHRPCLHLDRRFVLNIFCQAHG